MSNENNIPVYPFKGIDFTAEEINALLRSIPNKLDRDLVRDGKSAYDVAVQNGYTGTVTEWLQSLRGQKGDALTYSDLTDEQKQELKQPAIEAGNEVREQSSSVLKSNTQKTEQFITKAQNTLDSLETEIRKQSSSILASNTEKTNDLIEKSEETVSDLQKTIIDKADGILNANTQKTNQFITKAQNTLDSLETEIREQSNSVLESNSEKTNEFIKASETALDNAEKASEQAIENSKTHWLPTLDSQGNLSWSRSSSTVAPATKNIKGPQGNSGVSGSTDNIEVVNDLNGGESSPERIKVLSAEQGKVLNNKYSEVDKKINEFNISRLYPTNGTGGTNKYTLETAIAQVPAEYRVQGVKVTYVNENKDTESWEYKGGSWAVGSFSEVGAKKFSELDSELNTNGVLSSIKIRNGNISGQGTFVNTQTGNFKHCLIKVDDFRNKEIIIKTNRDTIGNYTYAFVQNVLYYEGQVPDYTDNGLVQNKELKFTIPTNANYLYLLLTYSGITYEITSLVVNGEEYFIKQNLNTIKANITEIKSILKENTDFIGSKESFIDDTQTGEYKDVRNYIPAGSPFIIRFLSKNNAGNCAFYAKTKDDTSFQSLGSLKSESDYLDCVADRDIYQIRSTQTGYSLIEGEQWNREFEILSEQYRLDFLFNILSSKNIPYNDNNNIGGENVQDALDIIANKVNAISKPSTNIFNKNSEEFLPNHYYRLSDCVVGGEYNGTLNSYKDDTFNCMSLPLHAGDTLKIKTYSTSSAALSFCIVGSDNIVLALADNSMNYIENPYSYAISVDGVLYINCSKDYLDNMNIEITGTVSLSDLNDKVDSLSERINSIEDNYNPFDGVVLLNTSSTILGLGASFMMQDVGGTLNTWFPKLAEKLGVKSINKAVGSTNICHHANALYNGEILSDGDAPLSEVDAIVIMHAHNKDVFTLPEGYSDYSWQDYETNGIVPFETTTGANQDDSVYAAAFDYVIKKIYALYFAVKSDYQYAEDTYFGQYAPQKPAQIILCTHWHDARTIYNESIRKLSKKWGLPLIRFDDKIGFTKNMPNPNTGYQSSLEFVANSSVDASKETIDGVVYGWHQMRGDCYIQRKMSAIACKSFEVL